MGNGDRQKAYESVESDRRFMPLLPVLARIDGRSFSKFTQGLERPFDERLSKAMIETTRHLVQHTNACVGYTQSDEISLAFYSPDYESKLFFDARVMKMTSQLAAIASVRFNKIIASLLPEKYVAKDPTFDCRVWQVPNLIEAANVFVWREWDATKNSISMAARKYFSHAQCLNKHNSQLNEMLFRSGVNWNDYPAFFKRGTYLRRTRVSVPFTAHEIAKLPPQHRARTNPDLVVERAVIETMDMPPITQIINRVGTLFLGEEPRVAISKAS